MIDEVKETGFGAKSDDAKAAAAKANQPKPVPKSETKPEASKTKSAE